MMIGIMSMVAFNLIDTYFVGQLGDDELAALSFTFPVIMLIFSLVQGMGIGATALIARSMGRQDLDKAARETTDSLVLGVIIAGIFVVIGLLTIEPTFLIMGASEELLPMIREYMEIWYLAIIFVVVPFIGNSAIRATGDATTPSLIMLFAVITNAVLDPLLIFGWGPIPAMGLKGAAIATAISRFMTLILSLYVLYFRKRLITFKVPSWEVLRGCWGSILFIGLPTGLSRMINPLAASFITRLLAAYGPYAVAAYGVGTRVEFLAFSLLIALSASIGPFTGQNWGAEKSERIRKAIDISSSFSLIWGVVASAVLFLFAYPIASIFTDDPEIIEATAMFLYIVPISFGFQGVVLIVNANLNTLGKPLHASLLIVIQMIVIYLPLAYLANHYGGVKGIFIAMAITYTVGGIISYAMNRGLYAKMSQQI